MTWRPFGPRVAFDASTDPVGRLAGRQEAEIVAAMMRAGQAALRGGVTTVRDLGDPHYLSLGLRGAPGMPAGHEPPPPRCTRPA